MILAELIRSRGLPTIKQLARVSSLSEDLLCALISKEWPLKSLTFGQAARLAWALDVTLDELCYCSEMAPVLSCHRPWYIYAVDSQWLTEKRRERCEKAIQTVVQCTAS